MGEDVGKIDPVIFFGNISGVEAGFLFFGQKKIQVEF
jgi:hypothetical protein